MPSSRARPATAGGGHARALGVQLVALAEPGDQHPAAAAAGGVLVGDGHLAQAGLRLAQVDQRLERGLAESDSSSKSGTTRVSAAVSLGRAAAG